MKKVTSLILAFIITCAAVFTAAPVEAKANTGNTKVAVTLDGEPIDAAFFPVGLTEAPENIMILTYDFSFEPFVGADVTYMKIAEPSQREDSYTYDANTKTVALISPTVASPAPAIPPQSTQRPRITDLVPAQTSADNESVKISVTLEGEYLDSFYASADDVEHWSWGTINRGMELAKILGAEWTFTAGDSVTITKDNFVITSIHGDDVLTVKNDDATWKVGILGAPNTYINGNVFEMSVINLCYALGYDMSYDPDTLTIDLTKKATVTIDGKFAYFDDHSVQNYEEAGVLKVSEDELSLFGAEYVVVPLPESEGSYFEGTATITKGGITITAIDGSSEITVKRTVYVRGVEFPESARINTIPVTDPVSVRAFPEIFQGDHIVIPLAAFCDALGYSYSYDANTKTFDITSPSSAFVGFASTHSIKQYVRR